jgi:hypothetical protein
MNLPMRKSLAAGAGLLLLLAALTACSGSTVRGEAPFVQVNSWRLQGEQLEMLLRLRNVNDAELAVETVDLSVRLDGEPLLSLRQAVDVTIPATGFESLRLSGTVSADGAGQLARLEAGEFASLPFVIDGRLETSGDGELALRREGRIYPMPGRPGEFR